MVELDIAPTTDGRIAVFHDWTARLPHRRQGRHARLSPWPSSRRSTSAMATPPTAGKTFPFRGKGVGAMPTLEEALAALPATPIMFNFKSNDPAEADLLARPAARKRARRRAHRRRLLRRHRSGRAASRGISRTTGRGARRRRGPAARIIVMIGWSGYMPESCRGRTMIVPLNHQWAFWGWPNRLIARMEAHGGARADGRPARQRRRADAGSRCPSSSATCRRASTATCGSRTSGRSGRRCARAGTGGQCAADAAQEGLERGGADAAGGFGAMALAAGGARDVREARSASRTSPANSVAALRRRPRSGAAFAPRQAPARHERTNCAPTPLRPRQ